MLLRDADAFVDNRDPQVIAGHDRQRAFGTAIGFDDVFGPDGDQSAIRHCLLRVHQNIGEHLNQLHFIGLHGPEIGRHIEVAADGGAAQRHARGIAENAIEDQRLLGRNAAF